MHKYLYDKVKYSMSMVCFLVSDTVLLTTKNAFIFFVFIPMFSWTKTINDNAIQYVTLLTYCY